MRKKTNVSNTDAWKIYSNAYDAAKKKNNGFMYDNKMSEIEFVNNYRSANKKGLTETKKYIKDLVEDQTYERSISQIENLRTAVTALAITKDVDFKGLVSKKIAEKIEAGTWDTSKLTRSWLRKYSDDIYAIAGKLYHEAKDIGMDSAAARKYVAESVFGS